MEDEKILELYRARDEKAIEETQKKYGAYCSSVAANILLSPEDREECLSDTCLHAWNAIPPEHPANLRMYLARITRNLAINRFLRTVSARECNVFLRRYFFTESNAQIAQRYGLTAGNVNVILLRTRRKLREYLVKEGYLHE